MEPQTYIALEDALARALSAAWVKYANPIISDLAAAMEAEDYARAAEIISTISFDEVEAKTRKLARAKGISALIYGSSNVVPPSYSVFLAEKLPPVLDSSIALLYNSLAKTGTSLVQSIASAVVQQIQQAPVDLTKSDTIHIVKNKFAGLAAKLNAAVLGTGKTLVNIGANLNTSRLVSYGFLYQGLKSGLEIYRVTEILDERTCPLCEKMHGREYSLKQSFDHLESILKMTDPDEIKEAAPFPKQSKEALDDLDKLTNADLQKRGWAIPPFHPLCRGILEVVGKATLAPLKKPKAKPLSDFKPADIKPTPVVPPASSVIQPAATSEITAAIVSSETRQTAKETVDQMVPVSVRGVPKDDGKYVMASRNPVDRFLEKEVSDALKAAGIDLKAADVATIDTSGALGIQETIEKKTLVDLVANYTPLATQGEAINYPLIINYKGQEIIWDGHARITAADLLGFNEVKARVITIN